MDGFTTVISKASSKKQRQDSQAPGTDSMEVELEKLCQPPVLSVPARDSMQVDEPTQASESSLGRYP